jgi:hypothetical protein
MNSRYWPEGELKKIQLDSIYKNIVSDPLKQVDEIKTKIESDKSLTDQEKSWLNDKLIFGLILLTPQEKQDEAYKNLDTLQLLSIRNHIVQFLSTSKKKWDTLIELAVNDNRFDILESLCQREEYCLWLAIAMKLTNVANRIQGTVKLEIPDLNKTASFQDRTVSKLIYVGNGQFERLFVADKRGKQMKPTVIPMGQTLSFYMGIWLLSTKTSHCVRKYVFDTGDGKEWTSASSDIRTALTEIIPEWLIPKQSELRILGEATMAVLFQFDRRSMNLMGLLSRHSVEVIEADYVKWSRLGRVRGLRIKPYVHEFDMKLDHRICQKVFDSIHELYKIPNTQRSLTNLFDASKLTEVKQGGVDWLNPIKLSHGTPLPLCVCGKYTTFQFCNSLENKIWAACETCKNSWYILDNTEKLSLPSMDLPKTVYPGEENQGSDNKNLQSKSQKRKKGRKSRQTQPRKLNYDVYIGIDTSLKATAIAILQNEVCSVDYWSEEKLQVEDRTDHFYTTHHTWDETTTLRKIRRFLLKKRHELPSNVQVAVEEPLPITSKHTKAQKRYTLELKFIVSKIFEGVVMVDNQLVKKSWYSSDVRGVPFVTPNKKKIEQWILMLKNVDSTPRKQRWKFFMYLVWMISPFPGLVSPQVELAIKTERRQNWDRVKSKSTINNTALKVNEHPVSDIVDSVAIVTYLRKLDMYGPTDLTCRELDQVDYSSDDSDSGSNNGFQTDRWLVEDETKVFRDYADDDTHVYVVEITSTTREKYRGVELIVKCEDDEWNTGVILDLNNVENDKHILAGQENIMFVFVKRFEERVDACLKRFKDEYTKWYPILKLFLS